MILQTTQYEHKDSLRAFCTSKAPILIIIGVSARGLDIHNVMYVINYDLLSYNIVVLRNILIILVISLY